MDILQYSSLLSKEDINYLLNDPNVMNAKLQIDKKDYGSVYFSVVLPESIKIKLKEKISLDLSNKNIIPMRWIKGDTQPHIDTSISSFEKTYLIYLTNSDGELIINNKSYPITEGSAYVFNEGLKHETIDTGLEPRLLLGPMNEHALSVGGPTNITTFIRQSGPDIQESTDQQNWTTITSWPYIINTNIQFITNITITTTNHYFIVNNAFIIVGNIYLNNDGLRPIITIDGVTNYPGLVQNGTNSTNGISYFGIINLEIRAINGSTLADKAGWFCQQIFCKNAGNNIIFNCSSNGPIGSNSSEGGGIVGSYSASGTDSLLTIIGCSSSGIIGINSGGIVGTYGGNNGNATQGGTVICVSCWSTGNMNSSSGAGGIFGEYGGDYSTASAISCYSTGNIGTIGGGIYGRFAGRGTNASATATNCYSLGNIDISGGGIFGGNSGFTGGSTQATNCYSVGIITTASNGIYGSSKLNFTEVNCYSANGSWSTTAANAVLTGFPIPTSIIGTTWVASVLNQPYELKNIGYTPYSPIIFLEGNFLTEYNATINAGDMTISALISGRNYTILQIDGGDSGSYNTITINSTTGVILTTPSTASGVYTIYIRNTGSYYISSVVLTVTSGGPIPCFTKDTTVLTPNGYVKITELKKDDLVLTSDNRIVPIVNIICRLVKGNKNTYPYIINESSISPNYPPEKTLLSGEHLIKNKNTWIHPKKSRKFEQDKTNDVISYYHIETSEYKFDNLVINGGLVVETFAGYTRENQIVRNKRISSNNKQINSNNKQINSNNKQINSNNKNTVTPFSLKNGTAKNHINN